MTDRISRPIPSEPSVGLMAGEIFLLRDDFENRIIPYQQRREAYPLTVAGTEQNSVLRSLSLDPGDWRPEDFIRAIASRLLTELEVWIEVVPNPNQGGDVAFHLFPVAQVRRTSSGSLVQILPVRTELPAGYPDDEAWGQSVELDSDRMVHVSLPSEYPKRLLQQVFVELSEIVSAIAPPWALQQMAGQRPDAPRFDVAQAERIERQRILQVASPIGWTARESYRSQPWRITCYNYLFRELRFLHFVASVRERAETALREVLDIAEGPCGFTASVTAHGIYTPEEIWNFIEDFLMGNLPFKRAREIIYQEVSDSAPIQSRTI